MGWGGPGGAGGGAGGTGGAERVVGRTPGAPSESAAHDPRDSTAHDAVVHTVRINEIAAYLEARFGAGQCRLNR